MRKNERGRWAVRKLTGLPRALQDQYDDLQAREIAEYLSDKSSQNYRAGQFMKSMRGDPEAAKWCREKGLALIKAQATNSNSAGGVLVPDEIANDIISILDEYGLVRAEAKMCRW